MNSYLEAARTKKCQSKKNTTGAGCGDVRCPQGLAIAAGLTHALKTENYELFEQISQIDKEHRASKEVSKLIAERVTPSDELETYKAWKLAPEGKSGWYCLSCNYALTKEEAGQVDHGLDKCPVCSDRLDGDLMGVNLLKESIPYFDSAFVKEQSWFHATAREDWLPSLQDMEDAPLAHLGTLESAITRGRDLREDKHRQYGSEWYLYEVKLVPQAYIEKNVYNDDNQKFPYYTSDLESNRYGNGVIRYVNSYEDPGSVSLIADPQKIVLVKATKVNADSF